MKIILSGRRFGKTSRMVNWVRGGERRVDGTWTRVMLCISQMEAERVQRQYYLDKMQVFDPERWERFKNGHRDVELGIDNAEFFLRRLVAGHKLSLMTFDDDEEIYFEPPVRQRPPKPKWAESMRIDLTPEITTGQEQLE